MYLKVTFFNKIGVKGQYIAEILEIPNLLELLFGEKPKRTKYIGAYIQWNNFKQRHISASGKVMKLLFNKHKEDILQKK